MPTKITYSVSFNYAKSADHRDDWHTDYEMLSEEDAKIVAVDNSNMKEARFMKLVNHTSKRFIHMRTKQVWVTKVLHTEDVETISYWEQLKASVKRLLEKTG